MSTVPSHGLGPNVLTRYPICCAARGAGLEELEELGALEPPPALGGPLEFGTRGDGAALKLYALPTAAVVAGDPESVGGLPFVLGDGDVLPAIGDFTAGEVFSESAAPSPSQPASRSRDATSAGTRDCFIRPMLIAYSIPVSLDIISEMRGIRDAWDRRSARTIKAKLARTTICLSSMTCL